MTKLPQSKALSLASQRRRIALAATILIGSWALLLAAGLHHVEDASQPWDWRVYVQAGSGFFDGSLYSDYGLCELCAYRYSPVMAPILGVLTSVGLEVWRIAHLLVLVVLPLPVALATILTWGFWWEFSTGHLTVFSFVLGFAAMRGNRWAAIGFIALALLMPKPLFVPVSVWLLWKLPGIRWPVAVLFVVHALAVLATGYAGDWVAALLTGTTDLGTKIDYGPARLIGAWWVLIGLPLAVWLTWKGRLGFASLAASPYWLPYYLVLVLWELVPKQRPQQVGDGACQARGRLRRGAWL